MSRSRRRRKPSLVLDTSVLCRGIQAFFQASRQEPRALANSARELIERWLRTPPRFDLICSEDIVEEYKAVLNELGLHDLNVGQVIGGIRRRGKLVTPAMAPRVSPDPGDDKFYAAALEGRVTAIVTANPRHFPAHEGVRILSPDEALRELDECGAR